MQSSHLSSPRVCFLLLCCLLRSHQADYRSGRTTLGDVPHWLIEMNYHHRRMRLQVLSSTDISLTDGVAKTIQCINGGWGNAIQPQYLMGEHVTVCWLDWFKKKMQTKVQTDVIQLVSWPFYIVCYFGLVYFIECLTLLHLKEFLLRQEDVDSLSYYCLEPAWSLCAYVGSLQVLLATLTCPLVQNVLLWCFI